MVINGDLNREREGAITYTGERLPRRGIKKFKCYVVGRYGNATAVCHSSVSVSGICDYAETLVL